MTYKSRRTVSWLLVVTSKSYVDYSMIAADFAVDSLYMGNFNDNVRIQCHQFIFFLKRIMKIKALVMFIEYMITTLFRSMRGCHYLYLSKNLVTNLGVILDQSLSMQSHVNIVARVCYSYLSKIARIRRFLDKEECKKIVHASVISKLDYCNVLLYGLPDSTLKIKTMLLV